MDESSEVTVKQKWSVTGSTLKIVAIVTMLIDHVGAVILERKVAISNVTVSQDTINTQEVQLYFVDFILRAIGRIAFPMFIFLLVQGFEHTRSRIKYAARLFLFALLAEVPFDLAHEGKFLEFTYQNIFFTLFLGFVFMYCADIIGKFSFDKKTGIIFEILVAFVGGAYLAKPAMDFIGSFIAGWNGNTSVEKSTVFPVLICGAVLAIGIFAFWRAYFSKELTVSEGYVYAVQGLVMFMLAWAARFMNTDYEGAGVIAIAIAYIFRKNNKNCIMSSVIVLTITNVMEAVAFLDVLLVERYNGQRGLKLKYIFYIIYPLHLIIYYFIARKLGIFPGKIGFPGTF